MLPNKIEYRVRPITRYVVTRYEEGAGDESVAVNARFAGSVQKGEYDNPDVAYEVAYALCKDEHQTLGWEPGDNRISYPQRLELKAA
jgi:hypothetical protein